MSIELTKKNIRSETVIYDGFCEQSIDSDINLPDYCPDIMRILKCTVQPSVTNSKIVGDRAAADGNAKIRVIYSDENNHIYCYDADFPFSKYAELSSFTDSAVLLCTAKADYINCRAVSKRRLDIHGAVSLHFRITACTEESVITSASGEGIQLRRKGADLSIAAASAAKTFQIAEVKNVGDSNPGIGKVIFSQAAPVINETKIIKGKILLKGETAVKIAYCSDSAQNEAAEMFCNIPFNEILEAPDFSDSCTAKSELHVINLIAEPKVDNDGEYRFMNISADICAKVTAYESESVTVISDAYSTEAQLDTGYSVLKLPKLQQYFSETVTCRQSPDISAANPKKIFSCLVSDPDVKCCFSDGRLHITGKIPLCFIVISEDGSPVSCEREAEFEYSRTVEATCKNPQCSPEVHITGFSCLLSPDGTADFKAEIAISAAVFSICEEKIISELSVSEGKMPKARRSSLTVYFCSGQESLWEIARKYNTTVEAIMEENELSADYLENKTMLMIPIK